MKNPKEKILVKGYEKSSLVEWPGKIVAIIFTPGCNFKCPYCHNSHIVMHPEEYDDVDFYKILEDLKLRRKWIDAIEITGGEPTIFPKLIPMLKLLKKEGFLVKLDSNGSNPKILEKILKLKLADYVAMDIKNCKEKYSETMGASINLAKIESSINIIKTLAPEYEFRTTILPKHHTKKDIEKIAKWLKGSKRYFLQRFKPGSCLNPKYDNEKTFSEEEAKELAEIAKKYIKTVEFR